MNRNRYNKKKKRRGGKFQRGFYQMINESKYRQPTDRTMNAQLLPEYRSSWEKVFYRWCDLSESVEYWGAEAFPIKYVSPKDNQIHRYFPDVMMKMISGEIILVEIKPKSQCNQPINLAKWAAAKEYCSKIGATFIVVTEVELKKWNLIK